MPCVFFSKIPQRPFSIYFLNGMGAVGIWVNFPASQKLCIQFWWSSLVQGFLKYICIYFNFLLLFCFSFFFWLGFLLFLKGCALPFLSLWTGLAQLGLVHRQPSPARNGTGGVISHLYTVASSPHLCFFPAGEPRRQRPASVSGGPSLAIRGPRAPPLNPRSIPLALSRSPPPP